MAERLAAEDPHLWLSRSWTTRARRDGEDPESYVFVDPETFERKIAEGGFYEWAEFLGNLYGTPMPDPPEGCDVLLEIDIQGAAQVRKLDPRAVIILLLPPSADAQAERLRRRGDGEQHVRRRLVKATEEEAEGRALADHVVVNDRLDRALSEVAAIVGRHRDPSGGA